jgi:tetratricopeptide (TPR) repeat protein
MILLKNKGDAQSVLSALDSGASFIKLAKEISVGANADRGGHIGTVDINRLKPELRDALKDLKPGQHTGVVETAMGHAIFQVTTDRYYEKGLKLFDEGRYQEAVQEFNRDIELNPDSAFSYFYMGLSQDKLNRPREAAASLEAAAKIDPDLAETYYNLGRVYTTLDRTDDAEKMYLKAIELAPEFHLAHNNLAWLYAKNNIKIDEGIRHAEVATKLRPSEPLFYHTLAELYMRAGRRDEAVGAMRIAVKLAPDNDFYREQLALLKTRKPKESTTLTRTAKKAPADITDPTRGSTGFMKLRSSLSQRTARRETEGKADKYTGLRIKVLNGNGIKGAAMEFVGTLESMGYQVEEVGNADNFDWSRTTVFYRQGRVDEALTLAHKIPGEQDVLRLRDHQPFDLVIILGRE